MEKDTYRSQFRLPQALYEKLKVEADKNRRSVNAELVARLERSFAGDQSTPAASKIFALLSQNFDDLLSQAISQAVQDANADTSDVKKSATVPPKQSRRVTRSTPKPK